jgi:hypothetical protein
MTRRKRTSTDRFRVGKFAVYLHHGAWWVYHSEGGERIRRKASESSQEAEQLAAQVNAQVAQDAPTLLSFQPISAPDLRQQFIDYHEHVLRSSVRTLCHYRRIEQALRRWPESLECAKERARQLNPGGERSAGSGRPHDEM